MQMAQQPLCRYQTRPAHETAILTLFMVANYAKESGKEISRFKISHKTLSRLANCRNRCRSAYIEDWRHELIERGWNAMEIEDHFAIIRIKSLENWVSLGAKRINETLNSISGDNKDAVWDQICEQIKTVLDPFVANAAE